MGPGSSNHDELKIDTIRLEALHPPAPPGAAAAQLIALGLNRAHKANALNEPMVSQMTAMLPQWRDDPEVRALFIYGVGKHFCAGADLRWMQASGDLAAADPAHIARALTELFKQLASFDKPIISYVHNSCMGGALGLISLADRVVAHRDSEFSFGESVVGLSPWVVYPYVAKVLPHQRLKHMMLSAERLSARAACELHLCHELISGRPHQRLARMIGGYLRLAPAAGRFTKQLCSRQLELTEYATGLAGQLASAECQAGLAHFFAKTQPPWCYSIPPESPFFALELSY